MASALCRLRAVSEFLEQSAERALLRALLGENALRKGVAVELLTRFKQLQLLETALEAEEIEDVDVELGQRLGSR